MSSPLVHTAFDFINQLLEKEPDARIELLEMLQSQENKKGVTVPDPIPVARPLNYKQSLKQLAHKKHWNKADWEHVKIVFPFKKLPKSLAEFLTNHLETKFK